MNQLLTADQGIHETAIVDPAANLAADVSVGAYSIIGPDVTIGSGTVIGPHVVVKGETVIGEGNRIFQFASVGEDPQDKKYAGEVTRLEVGDRNVIRECVTINRGTAQDNGITKIGSDNLFMAYVHVAHDCIIGNNTIFANNTQVAGHVTIGDWVILAGNSACHQFTTIGEHAFCGHDARVTKDILPFTLAMGDPAVPRMLNSTGLQRRGFTDEDRLALKRAFKILCRSKLPLEEAVAGVEALKGESKHIQTILDFLKVAERGVAR